MGTKTLGRLLAATATCIFVASPAWAGDDGLIVDTSSPITNYDTIEGDRIGIYSLGTNLILDNYGTVRGDGLSHDFNDPDAGIVIIGGPRDLPDGFVDIYNNSSGVISGASAGIVTSYFLNPETNQLEGRAIGVTIINEGEIIGETDDGVRLIGGGTVDNYGYIAGQVGFGADGISMFPYYDQDTSGLTSIGTVDNYGTIEGNRLGIILSDGGTVNNAGTINGGWAGAVVIQGIDPGKVGTIDNSGTINGDVTFNDLASASVANSGSINGAITFNGIVSAAVDNSGSIHSQDGAAPISSDGDLNISNSLTGSIVNDTQSAIISGGALTLDNAGEIHADQALAIISFGAADNITNSGTISSYWDAILTGDSPTTLSNSGSIESSHLDGAQLQAGGSVDNSGEIFGGTNGLLLGGPTSVTNETDGRILGGKDGILATGASLVVDNAGIIYGNGTNGSSTSPNGGIVISGGPATIENSGTISGQRFGITTSYFLNPETNEYEGRATGVTVDNSGSVIGSTDDGIRLIGGGTVTNSGYIAGQGSVADGISMFGYFADPEGPDGIGTVDNLEGGTIEGNRWGVILSGGGTVNNAGTITGPAFTDGLSGAILIQVSSPEKVGTVNNSGTINGDVGLHNLVNGTFINSGTLTGQAWFDVIDNASVVNSGTINGLVGSYDAGSISISNSGTIAAPTGPAIYSEVQSSLVNSGTISTTGPIAVSLQGANTADTVTLLTGSAITGAVDGGSGLDTLNLSGTVSSATPLQTVGQFLNFEALNVNGGYWTASTTTGTFGSTTINGGTLAVNGSIASPIMVKAGGTLGGSGTIVGNVSVGAGATLSPGNAVGTIHVTGNVSFASGSTFQVQTTPGGLSDLLAATGTVSLGSATLQIFGGSGTYAAQTQYTIITASGINGKFGTISSDLAFLKPVVAYKNSSVLLTLSRNGKPITSAATANMFSTATAIESLNESNSIYQAVLVQSVGGARQAFASLSGAAYGRLDALLASDLGHPQLGLEKSLSAAPSLQWNETSEFGASGFHSGSAMNRGAVSLMLVGGSYRTRMASESVQSDVQTHFVSSAVGYRSNRFQALASMTSAWHEIDATRSVTFPGFADVAQGRYSAQSNRLDLEGSYALSRGAIAIAPYAGASRFMLRSQGFNESGGITALSLRPYSSRIDQLRAGVRMSGDLSAWGARLLPHIDLSVRRSWAGSSRRAARFLVGSAEFDTISSGFDERAAIDAGADLVVGPVTFSATYRGQLGDRWLEHSGLLSASLPF